MAVNSANTLHHYDVLIIGSGAAGLCLAARLPPGLSIAILCKDQLVEGSSYYAQGGVAAVMDSNDSHDAHIEDTKRAGAGLCEEHAIAFTVKHAKESITWLIEHGVPFDQVQLPDGSKIFHLTQEGGHSHRRILHAADRTGRAVTNTLINIAKAKNNISYYEFYNAIDLITTVTATGEKHCLGVYALNKKDNSIKTIHAKITVLATGGASKVYLYSTNPDVSSGDGIAMAWRAGARVANMEFNQFHPTCLYHPKAKTFLISEALRGEGAKLKLPTGEAFMDRFDERAELAPRDIVARAIDHEMKRLGLPFVHLDISHKSAQFIEKHFPYILDKCLLFDIDIRKQPIPVVPAAHYTCGGVITNQYGQTDIPNLYAIGEVAYTGLHGANRMASNSLLECLVYATSASKHISSHYHRYKSTVKIPDWDSSQVVDSDEEVVVSHNWNELRHFMWDYVGIVRSDKRLARAKRRVDLLQQEIQEYYSSFRVTNNLLELRNLVLVAELIILSALKRKESRGLHYTIDYPKQNDAYKSKTVLTPPSYLAF